MRTRPHFVFTLVALLGGISVAEAVPRTRTHTRDRFSRTVSVGVTLGLGSPSGLAGGFVEFRPHRVVGLIAQGGLGGSFGPAVGGTLLLSPFGTRGWALNLEGSFSRQFTYATDTQLPGGRTIPGYSNWLSFGLSTEWRPSRSLLIRVGGGYAMLLNTNDFGIVRADELPYVEQALGDFPGADPLDAARASLAGERFGVWYFHIDIAPVWRF